MLNVPILIIGFNRPELLADLVESLRAVKPKTLFIAIDGPRPHKIGESALVEQCKQVVHLIDWDCDIQTKFNAENLGCGVGVSSAISWAFDSCEQVIILEDDIRVDNSFFQFAEAMLEIYKNDKTVLTVSAHSPVSLQSENSDYWFSAYPEIWGWATWKSTWDSYKFEIDETNNPSVLQILKFSKFNFLFALSTWKAFKDIAASKIDTWDYQVVCMSLLKNGMHVIPSTNLMDNVGFGELATHTVFNPRPLPKRGSIKYPLRHPSVIAPNRGLERASRREKNRQLIWSAWQALRHIFR